MIRHPELDARGRLILGLAATGMTNGEIARYLAVGRDEVDRQMGNAITVLSARSKLEAVLLALRLRLIDLPHAGQ